jgi:hypothetical protein
VAVKERANVEKREAQVIVEHDVRGLVTGDDPAEETVQVRSHQCGREAEQPKG